MIHYQCWDESYRAFLHPVIGDLSTEKFGLSEELWQELTEKIQVIYHNGALLNFVFPYEFLKETNVHGTVETCALPAPVSQNIITMYLPTAFMIRQITRANGSMKTIR